jgi:hypothetical protein
MKKLLLLLIIITLCVNFVNAQEPDIKAQVEKIRPLIEQHIEQVIIQSVLNETGQVVERLLIGRQCVTVR